MEVIIIVLFLGFMGYREWVYSRHIKDLELLISAKDPQEYARLRAVDKPQPQEIAKEDYDLIDPMDVSAEEALKGME